MWRGRSTEDQIICVLREREAGVKTVELCRKHGMSDATFDNRKAKCGVAVPFGHMPCPCVG